MSKCTDYYTLKDFSFEGIMFWTIDNDDTTGKCHGEAFPIIKAAKKALLKSLR